MSHVNPPLTPQLKAIFKEISRTLVKTCGDPDPNDSFAASSPRSKIPCEAVLKSCLDTWKPVPKCTENCCNSSILSRCHLCILDVSLFQEQSNTAVVVGGRVATRRSKRSKVICQVGWVVVVSLYVSLYYILPGKP